MTFKRNKLFDFLLIFIGGITVGVASAHGENTQNNQTGGADVGCSDTIKWVANEQMPILSWHSIDLKSTSLESYQDFKNCGYTLSLPTIWSNEDPSTNYSADLLQAALDVTEKKGVKMIAGCHELHTDPENTINSINGGLGGIIETAISADKINIFNLDWSLRQPTLWVMLLGGMFSSIITYGADQTMVQRYLTTKTQEEAEKSVWTNAFLTVPATLIFFFLGTALFAFFKENPSQLY